MEVVDDTDVVDVLAVDADVGVPTQLLIRLQVLPLLGLFKSILVLHSQSSLTLEACLVILSSRVIVHLFDEVLLNLINIFTLDLLHRICNINRDLFLNLFQRLN